MLFHIPIPSAGRNNGWITRVEGIPPQRRNVERAGLRNFHRNPPEHGTMGRDTSRSAGIPQAKNRPSSGERATRNVRICVYRASGGVAAPKMCQASRNGYCGSRPLARVAENAQREGKVSEAKRSRTTACPVLINPRGSIRWE